MSSMRICIPINCENTYESDERFTKKIYNSDINILNDVYIPCKPKMIYESDYESAYIINSNDKFIKMICDIYNIN